MRSNERPKPTIQPIRPLPSPPPPPSPSTPPSIPQSPPIDIKTITNEKPTENEDRIAGNNHSYWRNEQECKSHNTHATMKKWFLGQSSSKKLTSEDAKAQADTDKDDLKDGNVSPVRQADSYAYDEMFQLDE
tara:strand:+ start:50 stop:445 length:396 start_codon:yes stop_codon:yes gene_type:complete